MSGPPSHLHISFVPRGTKLATKFPSFPCTASDHHSGTRETWPSSLLGGKRKNYLNRFRACLGSPYPSHSRTGQTCSRPSPLTFDPIHTEFHILPNSSNSQIPQIRLWSSSANVDLTSVGLHLQGHFYPSASSYKHCHPARHGRWLQSLLSEEPEPLAAPAGLSSPHPGSLLTQEVISHHTTQTEVIQLSHQL